MLCELRVKNLALIEALTLSFDQQGSGLVVMTGETGAGKSIMLRAIHLLSGSRASADWVRSGAENCEVEALFEINPRHHRLLARLEEGGFGRDTSVVIKRVLSSAGKSRLYVNGSLATAKTVSELTIEMLNVAGQHDQQQLLQPASHLDFLDTLGDLWAERGALAEAQRNWQGKRDQLAELLRQEQEKAQRQDFLQYQLQEIVAAAPQPGEDEQLHIEKKRLKNAEALIALSIGAYRLLANDLQDGLAQLRQDLAQLAALDSGAAKLAEEISGFTYLAEDHAVALRRYRETLDNDPFRLEQINERLDLLQGLKRKYGQSITEILAYAEAAERELLHLEDMDRTIVALEEEVAGLAARLCVQAAALSARRRQVAEDFEKAMAAELQSLAFDRAAFAVCWKESGTAVEDIRASGWDRGEFFFSANPGEELRPLAKIASGGELSRLMLAMKCLLAKKDMVETVIFDEVDTGIGGEAAEAVARKIQELAGHHQVFCITHLPQIAARGSQHYQVNKTVVDGRTQSVVVPLGRDSRVRELVRMLAGSSATEQTQAWAEELLVMGGSGR
jgi:DNA repair protein RecN (Recombination protein N)